MLQFRAEQLRMIRSCSAHFCSLASNQFRRRSLPCQPTINHQNTVAARSVDRWEKNSWLLYYCALCLSEGGRRDRVDRRCLEACASRQAPGWEKRGGYAAMFGVSNGRVDIDIADGWPVYR